MVCLQGRTATVVINVFFSLPSLPPSLSPSLSLSCSLRSLPSPSVILPHCDPQWSHVRYLRQDQPPGDQLEPQAGMSLPVQAHSRLVWLLTQ